MISTRCQVCGRRKATTGAGGMVKHHVAGAPCLGTGFPPIAVSDARLVEAIAIVDAQERAEEARIEAMEAAHAAARRNEPLPWSRFDRRIAITSFRRRLERRLARWRDRHARAARQMAKYGWSDPV